MQRCRLDVPEIRVVQTYIFLAADCRSGLRTSRDWTSGLSLVAAGHNVQQQDLSEWRPTEINAKCPDSFRSGILTQIPFLMQIRLLIPTLILFQHISTRFGK